MARIIFPIFIFGSCEVERVPRQVSSKFRTRLGNVWFDSELFGKRGIVLPLGVTARHTNRLHGYLRIQLDANEVASVALQRTTGEKS